jgi:RNA polymerase sigma-70 factor, ECF subfamily
MILRKRRVRSKVLFDPQPDDRCEAIALEVKDSAPNPEELCALHQHQHRALHAIRRLSPHLQAPIRMRIMHEWSIREISRALNISEAAVKSRLYRARLRLSTAHEPNAFVRSKKDLQPAIPLTSPRLIVTKL